MPAAWRGCTFLFIHCAALDVWVFRTVSPSCLGCGVTVAVGKMTIEGCKVVFWDVGGQVGPSLVHGAALAIVEGVARCTV